MQRAAFLVLCAGIAGAAVATLASQAFTTTAVAQAGAGGMPQSFATCDMLMCLERVLDSPDYASEREAAARPWNDQIQLLANELTAVRDTLSQLEPNDPTAQGHYQQYQSLAGRINSLRQEADMDIDRFAAEQLAQAYVLIHGVVQSVGEARGYTSVLTTRLTVDDLDPQNTNAMVQEVMMRPVLRADAAHDITDDVITALNLPEPTPEPEAGGAEPAGPQPGGG